MESDEIGRALAAVADNAVGVLREYTGRGASTVRAFLRDDVLVILMEDFMTKAERTLVEAGYKDKVLDGRHAFQETMRDPLTASVERELGRKVVAFMSANHVDPDLIAELFVLQPAD
jgi:uncharacterized protein YbcI